MNEFNDFVVCCLTDENQDKQLNKLQTFLLSPYNMPEDVSKISNYPKVFKNFILAAHKYLTGLPTAICNDNCVNINGKMATKFLKLLNVFQPFSIFSVHNLNDYVNVEESLKLQHLYQISFTQDKEFPSIKLINCWIKLLYVNKQNKQPLFSTQDKMKSIISGLLVQGDAKLVIFLRICSLLIYINYFLNQSDQAVLQRNLQIIIQFASEYFSQNLSDLVDQLYKNDINKELGIFNDQLTNYLYNDIYNKNMQQKNSYNSVESSLFYKKQMKNKKFTILQYLFDKLIQAPSKDQQQSRSNILDTILEQIIVNVNNQKLKALDYCINLDILNTFQQIRENLNIKFTDTIIQNYSQTLYKEINEYMLQYHIGVEDDKSIIYYQKSAYLIENYGNMLLNYTNDLIYDSIHRLLACIHDIYQSDPSLFHVENEIYLFHRLNQYSYNSQIQKHINNLKNITVCLNGKLSIIRFGYQTVDPQLCERMKFKSQQCYDSIQYIIQEQNGSKCAVKDIEEKLFVQQKQYYDYIKTYNDKITFLDQSKQQQNIQTDDNNWKNEIDKVISQNKQYVVDIQQSYAKINVIIDYNESYAIYLSTDLLLTLQNSELLNVEEKKKRTAFLQQIGFINNTETKNINKNFPFSLFEFQPLTYVNIQSQVDQQQNLVSIKQTGKDNNYTDDKQLKEFELSKVEAFIMKTVKLRKTIPINQVIEASNSNFNNVPKETINEILKQLVTNAHLDLDDVQNVIWLD